MQLNRYHYITNEGDTRPTRTRDSWEIPDGGAEICCRAWKRAQTIKPYGDDALHVIVGFTVYHRDEYMEILTRNEKEGYAWGIEGVTMKREQFINGQWLNVAV